MKLKGDEGNIWVVAQKYTEGTCLEILGLPPSVVNAKYFGEFDYIEIGHTLAGGKRELQAQMPARDALSLLDWLNSHKSRLEAAAERCGKITDTEE